MNQLTGALNWSERRAENGLRWVTTYSFATVSSLPIELKNVCRTRVALSHVISRMQFSCEERKGELYRMSFAFPLPLITHAPDDRWTGGMSYSPNQIRHKTDHMRWFGENLVKHTSFCCDVWHKTVNMSSGTAHRLHNQEESFYQSTGKKRSMEMWFWKAEESLEVEWTGKKGKRREAFCGGIITLLMEKETATTSPGHKRECLHACNE